ncbi:hypothetical protein [Pseudomonas amygdali]|uniref:hypothetical protein n=1 Tax=Pseudomonas amygdali TaxID=47877 RepID=UPI001604CA29|nr:hypothetical protein [Pseudomonas amygdali]
MTKLKSMFLLLRDRKNGRFAAAGCPVHAMAAAYEGLAEVTISAEYFGADAVKSENPQVSIALNSR